MLASPERAVGARRVASSFHEFTLAAVSPWIVSESEANPVRYGGVVVEKENGKRIRVRVSQVHFAEDLKRLGAELPGIRRQSMRHFEAILVRLVFHVAAEAIPNRICHKK